MARAKRDSTSWPFPFFGAGDASYFEWAEVHVLFSREPSKTEKRKIKQQLPLALSDSFDWEGPALMVASDQFAHVAIAEQFARDEDEEEEDDDDDDDDEGRWFFASSAAVTRFNEATEAWLRHAHEVCPISVAFRREDGESGGTELSAWHGHSVRQLPELLSSLRELMQAAADSHRAYLLRGVLDMGREAKAKLPDDLLDWLDPARVLEPVLASGDAEQLIERLVATGERGRSALEACYRRTKRIGGRCSVLRVGSRRRMRSKTSYSTPRYASDSTRALLRSSSVCGLAWPTARTTPIPWPIAPTATFRPNVGPTRSRCSSWRSRARVSP
jgi:hypothetical protein